MKNKKLLSILLALTLAFSAVGCGAAGGGSVDKSLTADASDTEETSVSDAVSSSLEELFTGRDLSGKRNNVRLPGIEICVTLNHMEGGVLLPNVNVKTDGLARAAADFYAIRPDGAVDALFRIDGADTPSGLSLLQVVEQEPLCLWHHSDHILTGCYIFR